MYMSTTPTSCITPGSDIILFWKAYEEFGEFSQWYRSVFVYGDKTFDTAEQCMMYMKAIIFGDGDMAIEILRSRGVHPAEHRDMGRRVAGFDEVKWMGMSMRVVVSTNFCKFTQNDELMKKLMDTDGKMIVEASPYDRIWGIGFDSMNALSNRSRWGNNKLGTCLMTVRDMIADTFSLMRGDMGMKIPVNTTTILMCYFCFSMTILRPKHEKADDSATTLMVTTCSSCMETKILAFGEMKGDMVERMIFYIHERTSKTGNIDLITSRYPKMIKHPDTIRFMDVANCIVTKIPSARTPT